MKHKANFLTIVSLTKGLARLQSSELITEAERGLLLRRSEVLLRAGAALSQSAVNKSEWAAGMFFTGRALLNSPASRSRGAALLLGLARERLGIWSSRAAIAVGNFYQEDRQFEHAKSYYHEAERMAERDLSLVFIARRNEAVAYAVEGKQSEARTKLESLAGLVPYVATTKPLYALEYFNSLALVLAETGEKDRALKLSDTVRRSPFARFYPEFHQTYQEITSAPPRKTQITVPDPACFLQRQPCNRGEVAAERERHLIWVTIWENDCLTARQLRAYRNAGEAAMLKAV